MDLCFKFQPGLGFGRRGKGITGMVVIRGAHPTNTPAPKRGMRYSQRNGSMRERNFMVIAITLVNAKFIHSFGHFREVKMGDGNFCGCSYSALETLFG